MHREVTESLRQTGHKAALGKLITCVCFSLVSAVEHCINCPRAVWVFFFSREILLNLLYLEEHEELGDLFLSLFLIM